jgi:hypothetical protein
VLSQPGAAPTRICRVASTDVNRSTAVAGPSIALTGGHGTCLLPAVLPRTAARTKEAACIDLLPERRSQGSSALAIPYDGLGTVFLTEGFLLIGYSETFDLSEGS